MRVIKWEVVTLLYLLEILYAIRCAACVHGRKMYALVGGDIHLSFLVPNYLKIILKIKCILFKLFCDIPLDHLLSFEKGLVNYYCNLIVVITSTYSSYALIFFEIDINSFKVTILPSIEWLIKIEVFNVLGIPKYDVI